jgi:phosphatidate cytidylyltransferase
MLRHRLLLGPVLIAALLGVFWVDASIAAAPIPAWLRPAFFGRDAFPPGLAMFVLAMAISPLASRELVNILRANGIMASKRATWLATVLGLGVSCVIPVDLAGSLGAAIVASVAAFVVVGSLMFYSRKKTVEGVVAATGGTLFAFVYLGLLFGFLLAIRREHSAWLVLGVLLITKSCDIGAYFTGRALGRHKLIPWLSPGKTWEGLAGGVALATVLGVVGAWFSQQTTLGAGYELWQGAVLGAILALVGQLGDLLASLLKRDAGIKDSSNVLPGFGGVLDVIDSPLLAGPAAFWLLVVFDALNAGPAS